MHLNPINYKEFIIKFNSLKPNDRDNLYRDKDFIQEVFSIGETEKKSLQLFLLKMPNWALSNVYNSSIVLSILNKDPAFKLMYIEKYCTNIPLKQAIFTDQRVIEYFAHNLTDLGKYSDLPIIIIHTVADYLVQNDFIQLFYLFLIQVDDKEKYVSKYISYLKNKVASSNYVEKILEMTPSLMKEFNSNEVIDGLLQRDYISFYSFFDIPCLYSDNILNDSRIQQKMAEYQSIEDKKNSIYLFRHMMQSLSFGNNNKIVLQLIEKKRKETIGNVLENQDISFNEFKELLVEYLFEDYLENVIEKIQVILDCSNEDIDWLNKIGASNINLLKQFLMVINSCSTKETLRSYFEEMKHIDIHKILNDCYDICHSLASLDLCSSVTTVNELLLDKTIHKSKFQNISIIELKGEKFNFLIHKSRLMNVKDVLPYEPMTSLSFVTHNNIESGYELEDSVIYGFDNVKPSAIIHICSSDSFSLINSNNNRITMFKKPTYVKSTSLIEKTGDYNEIVVSNRDTNGLGGVLRPTYVLSYDVVDAKTLEAAMINDLPIILINKQYYKMKTR